eukprot:gene14965-20132_t
MNGKRIQCIGFGDSFVNVLDTLRSPNFQLVKFKGANIKGLINKNENYSNILNNLKDKEYDFGFFIFGQVDFAFYYFYKKYLHSSEVGADESLGVLDMMFENAERYVCMVRDLPNIKNKCIFAVLPTHIADKDYKLFLVNYGIFTEENIGLITDENDYNIHIRNQRIIEFNRLLEIHCNTHNVLFVSGNNYMIDYDRLKQKNELCVNTLFLLEHNPLNIHIKYEYVLIVLLRTSALKVLSRFFNFNQILNKAESNYNSYIRGVLEKHRKPEMFDEVKFSARKIVKLIDDLKDIVATEIIKNLPTPSFLIEKVLNQKEISGDILDENASNNRVDDVDIDEINVKLKTTTIEDDSK